MYSLQSQYGFKQLIGVIVGVNGYQDNGNEMRNQIENINKVQWLMDEFEFFWCKENLDGVFCGEIGSVYVVYDLYDDVRLGVREFVFQFCVGFNIEVFSS